MCRKQPGIVVGKLCQRCEGKCVVCDSLVSQTTEARICDECNYGTFQVRSFVFNFEKDAAAVRHHCGETSREGTDIGFMLSFLQPLAKGKCIVCGGAGVSAAFYCYECTVLEKDRDGCPKIVNVGTAKIDLVYEKKKYKR